MKSVHACAFCAELYTASRTLEAMALTEIGGYRLERELGSGGMGVVYLGYDATGVPVAVKVLHPHIANDETARARLAREVRTLRRIKHPRIAQVYDAELDGPQPFLVTQYVDGPTLAQDVREGGPFDQAELVHFGHALLDALSAVHAAGVIHRDLKPANVMIMNGEPMVIDFGIAQVADEIKVTATGLVMGTPGYLSPELADGKESSEATDWWGWGATVAFAATGRNPFGSGPLEAVLGRVATGKGNFDGAPAGFVPLLQACLAPDPGARPGPEDILAALVDIEGGQVPQLQPAAGRPVVSAAPEGPTTVLPSGKRAAVYPGHAYPGPARPAQSAETVVAPRLPERSQSQAGRGRSPVAGVAPAGAGGAQGAPMSRAGRASPMAQGAQVQPMTPAGQALPATRVGHAPPVPAQQGVQPGPQPRGAEGYGGAPVAGQIGALGLTSVNAPVAEDTGGQSNGQVPVTHTRRRAGGGWAVAALVFAAWALAPFAPIVMVIVAYLWQLVARTAGSVLGRRYRYQMTYGVQPASGGAGAVVGVPAAAIGSIFTSVFCLILPLLAAVAVGVLVKLDVFDWIPGWMSAHAALLSAAAAGVVVLWLGPGSRNLRRGSVGVMRGVLQSNLLAELLTTVGLMIIGCIAVSSGLANDVVHWWPISFDPLAWVDKVSSSIG